MDEFMVALLVGFIIVAIFLALLFHRDMNKTNNETEKYKVTRKTDSEEEVARLQLEAQKLTTCAEERQTTAKLQTKENIALLESKCKLKSLDIEEKRLDQGITLANISTEQVDMKCKTAVELAELSTALSKHQIDSQSSLISSAMKIGERIQDLGLEFRREELVQRGKETCMELEARKYSLDKRLEEKKITEQVISERFKLGCLTELELGKRHYKTKDKEIEAKSIQVQRQIQSTERNFQSEIQYRREREETKTIRAEAKSRAEMAKAFSKTVSSVTKLAINASSPGASHLAEPLFNRLSSTIPSIQNMDLPNVPKLPSGEVDKCNLTNTKKPCTSRTSGTLTTLTCRNSKPGANTKENCQITEITE